MEVNQDAGLPGRCLEENLVIGAVVDVKDQELSLCWAAWVGGWGWERCIVKRRASWPD